MEITRELVLKLAELTRIEMADEEAEAYRKDLAAILAYFENLSAVDTADVAPTARVFEGDARLGDDVAGPSLTREDLAQIAGARFDPERGVFVLQDVLPTAP